MTLKFWMRHANKHQWSAIASTGRQWPAVVGNGQQWSAMVRNSTVIVRKFQARNHCRGNHSAFWSPSAHESEELAAQTLRVPGPSRLSNNQGQKAHVSSPDGTGTSELCTVQWRETPQMALSEDRVPHGTPWVSHGTPNPNGSPLRQPLELQGQTRLSQLCSRQARAWVDQRYSGG